MSGHAQGKGGVIRFLVENSLLLIIGAVAALVWANTDGHSYHEFIHFDLAAMVSGDDGHVDTDHGAEPHGDAGHEADDHGDDGHAEAGHGGESHADGGGGHHGVTIHFLINDVLMALFFAIAGKEVWESLLPGGALANPRKAATPLLATLGGILGPVVVYLAGAALAGGDAFAAFKNGWAVPCATDIAFSYLVARFIFGGSHPAIAFLLLLAIADDAAGLIILAIFYPTQAIEPMWFLLTVAAIALAWGLQKMRVQSHWWYLLGPGVMCWFSFYFAHIHPALGLVPIIPMLPHAQTDLGIFAREELNRDDTLNAFEHFWKVPVEYILGLFGLVNAGVVLSSVGTGTWLVLAGLLIGKPVGITLMTLLAEKGLKLQKPAGMDYRHVVTLGMVAGIGFTVALFVSVAAFKEPGAIQDSVKMGALLSFLAAPLAIAIGRGLGVRPESDDASGGAEAAAA
ncbi:MULTISPECIES: Na+/H+ antiporter NhaA [Crateriforma]|uniref:Na(+)/H(+) antiporter NhaA n=1 Tax=Crateriforma conspicua TaxID=2527996 RepID=A0A5C5YAW4_9PLAN|nr:MULTISPECIES: Na+/H+ antiporter NhaA [Crateriforma]TWT72109.1 Na(+)/H(+) antiporter NhaA [Crateriforma conspicua]